MLRFVSLCTFQRISAPPLPARMCRNNKLYIIRINCVIKVHLLRVGALRFQSVYLLKVMKLTLEVSRVCSARLGAQAKLPHRVIILNKKAKAFPPKKQPKSRKFNLMTFFSFNFVSLRDNNLFRRCGPPFHSVSFGNNIINYYFPFACFKVAGRRARSVCPPPAAFLSLPAPESAAKGESERKKWESAGTCCLWGS